MVLVVNVEVEVLLEASVRARSSPPGHCSGESPFHAAAFDFFNTRPPDLPTTSLGRVFDPEFFLTVLGPENGPRRPETTKKQSRRTTEKSKAAAWNGDSPLQCPGGEPRATPGGREQDLHLHALDTHAEARVPSHKGPNAGKTCGHMCMKPSPRPAMSCVSSFIAPGLHASAQRPYAVAHAGR